MHFSFAQITFTINFHKIGEDAFGSDYKGINWNCSGSSSYIIELSYLIYVYSLW